LVRCVGDRGTERTECGAEWRVQRAIARQLARGGSLGAIDRPITTPVLELHGADDGCVVPPTLDDRHRFAGPRVRELIPGVGHFLQIETPIAIAGRLATWFATGH
jgi:pimeloyl-ACP methyl ester carboxylesterase